jgi:hypothetical protein
MPPGFTATGKTAVRLSALESALSAEIWCAQTRLKCRRHPHPLRSFVSAPAAFVASKRWFRSRCRGGLTGVVPVAAAEKPFQSPCPPRGIKTVSPTRLKCRYSGYRLPPQLRFFVATIQSFALTAVAPVTDSRDLDGDPACHSRKRLSC